MKNLKKTFALLLALAMLASLLVVNVSATEDTKVYIGSKSVLCLAESQEVIIPVFLKNTAETAVSGICCVLDYDTDVLTLTKISFKAGSKSLCTNEDANFANQSNKDVKKIAGLDFNAWNHTFSYDDADLEDETKANFALLTFEVVANAEAGDYTITGAMDSLNTIQAAVDGEPGETINVADQFTIIDGKIEVVKKQYINEIEEYTVAEAVEYGADVPELPETLNGLGKTSNEVEIGAEDAVALVVAWNEIDTFVEPNEYTVDGIVEEPVSDTIEFKSEDYAEDVDSLTAIANYEISKSTAGVVAPVEIDVEARLGGAEAAIADIVAFAEVTAVEETTIAIDGGEEEAVELDWENASAATADSTLHVGTVGDSIVLSVPVTAENTTYYDLEGKTAEVTITVAAAEKMYSETKAVTIETEVEYGASAPVLPETVIGLGQTAGGQEITEEYGDAFTVVWDAVDTFQTPGAKTVNGTVAEPEDDLISFKNADYTADVDTLTATANYTIAKSKAGIVAPVAAIEVRKKDAGTEAEVAAIVKLDEIKAVATTTIAIEGGATETVTLNWAAATPADGAKTTLNLGSETDSIVLNVPVAAEDTTYYDLDGKFVAVTIQMIPAWDFGDVDHNGSVTFADAQLTAKFAVAGELEGFDAKVADVDGVNDVTFTDAQLIARKAVNQSYLFPVEQ